MEDTAPWGIGDKTVEERHLKAYRSQRGTEKGMVWGGHPILLTAPYHPGGDHGPKEHPKSSMSV